MSRVNIAWRCFSYTSYSCHSSKRIPDASFFLNWQTYVRRALQNVFVTKRLNVACLSCCDVEIYPECIAAGYPDCRTTSKVCFKIAVLKVNCLWNAVPFGWFDKFRTPVVSNFIILRTYSNVTKRELQSAFSKTNTIKTCPSSQYTNKSVSMSG